MMTHVVMWRVATDSQKEKQAIAKQIKASLESLDGRVPGLLKVEVGCDESEVDASFDVVLISQFADEAALRCYATHPEHLRVKKEMAGLSSARYQVDFSSEESAHHD
jgi:quinol monooxygenase YgiN